MSGDQFLILVMTIFINVNILDNSDSRHPHSHLTFTSPAPAPPPRTPAQRNVQGAAPSEDTRGGRGAAPSTHPYIERSTMYRVPLYKELHCLPPKKKLFRLKLFVRIGPLGSVRNGCLGLGPSARARIFTKTTIGKQIDFPE